MLRFLLRNRDHLTYDDEWRLNWRIKLVYRLHFAARALNKRIYQTAFKD